MTTELQSRMPEAAKKGLVFALLLDGQGGASPLTMDEVEQWKEDDGFLWLHFDSSAQETKDYML